jgi:hypothetical protein
MVFPNSIGKPDTSILYSGDEDASRRIATCSPARRRPAVVLVQIRGRR